MKQVFWGIAGCFVLAILIFHEIFFTQFASWSLHAYSLSKWGKPLQYEHFALNGNEIVLTQPHFENENSFHAEQILFRIKLNYSKPQIHIDIQVDKPHWDFHHNLNSGWEDWMQLLSQEGKWIKTNPSIVVKDGILSWPSDTPDGQNQLYIDMEMNNHSGGFVKLSFDPAREGETLFLQTSKMSHGVKVDCMCNQLHCSSLTAFARFLGIDASPWIVQSGSLQGSLSAIFPKNERPYLEGAVALEKIAFHRIDNIINGEIGKASLSFEKNQLSTGKKDVHPTTIGKLELIEPASLVYQSPDQNWSVSQLRGSIQLDETETVIARFYANGGNLYHHSNWMFEGKANLNAKQPSILDATLTCSATDQAEGKIHFALHQLLEGKKKAEIQCERLNYSECSFLQGLLATHWPIFNSLLLQDGEFNAAIAADIVHGGLGELYISHFEASHLRSKLIPWNMTCDFEHVRGYGKVQLGSHDFLQTLHSAIHLEDGRIEFDDLSPPLPLTDVQAHLLIQQGHIEHSLVTLQVAGLKGVMDIEWGEQKQLLTFKLDGTAEDLTELFPSAIQDGFNKYFSHDRLMVLANLRRQNRKIELDGTLHIQRMGTEIMDLVHFGCELKKNQGHEKDKYVPVGWFHAQNLPLSKFLSPFIFRNGVLRMTGEGEFKGSFDDQFLEINYDAKNLKMENEDLCIDIPQLLAQVPGQLAGSHKVNLHTYAYEGSLPIQSATYYEKNTGLIFQDIHGMVKLKNDLIRIQPIEAYCQGVNFNGELELDYSDPAPRVFDLTICCPSFSGKISQIQNMLSHSSEPSLLHKIPLDGDVNGKDDGLRLKFAFVPHNYHLQADIKGAITDGALSLNDADMAIRGIYMDVEYHHHGQLLELSDIQGTLLVGKPRRVEEYQFSGSHIQFENMANPNLKMDIAIHDKDDELFRFSGYTKEEEDGIKSLYLNKNISHFSCIYPQVWQCKLRDWSIVEQFEFRSQFDLSIFLQDLRRFRQTGFLFLSHNVIDRLSQYLPFEGKGFLTLKQMPDKTYSYQLEGLNIKKGDDEEHYGTLKGSKQDKKWIIDQLQWDEWNVSAELHQMPEKWRIPYLTLKVDQALLLGLEGEWLQEPALLQAKIKLCRADLSELGRFQVFKPFVTKWWPSGVLNATGEMEWNLLASNPLEGIKASLTAEVNDLTFRDYYFSISSPFQINLRPFHYIKLNNVRVGLPPYLKHSYIDLKHFEYDLPKDAVSSLEVAFDIPHTHLEIIGEAMNHHFPDLLEASIKDSIVSSKQQDSFKGILAIETDAAAAQSLLRLDMEDGNYRFKEKEYDLKNFQMKVVGGELQYSAHTQMERCPFQVVGRACWPSCNKGSCNFISKDALNPLSVIWEKSTGEGFTIRSIQGDFCGCSFLLSKSEENAQKSAWIPLHGQIVVDFNRLCDLLSIETAVAIGKLKVGSQYLLGGYFWLKPEAGISFLNTISFKGDIVGNESILKGYQLESLHADLQYVPGRLDIQNFVIQDPAGTMKANNGIVIRDVKNDRWDFFIPLLSVKNLRPSLLRNTDVYAQTNSKFRSLILKRIDFNDLQGDLNKISTWQAQGDLHFMNPTRKGVAHNPLDTLLAIPAEIILRLGLDPHVMNPVTGAIYFNLQNEKFYMNRFKDVYSEGRGSKFYLAQSAEPSWMDLDGNLSVNIGMKQYNLIFKLAELFTVSIQGDIRKPIYRLQKQKGSRKHPYNLKRNP